MDFLGLPRREKPCERCGWRYVGFHVCFDASKPCPGEGKLVAPKKVKDKGEAKDKRTMAERWSSFREENRSRDEEIVEMYKEGAPLQVVADKFGLSRTTIIKVINREEIATGQTIMRPRHLNTRYDKEAVGGFNG